GRGAEAAGHGGAQGDRVAEGVARRELARGLAAEVRVVLVAGGDAGRQPLAQVRLQPGVDRMAVALVAAGVARGEAAEALGAGAEVGIRLARSLAPFLVAVLGAEGNGGRVGQADV